MASTSLHDIFEPVKITKTRFKGVGLKGIREALDLSLRDLASMTGVSANYWHLVETGKNLVTEETKEKLLNALKSKHRNA
jgi:transcriptional regulator with XRE-family HTH domain